jgi:hypothetical protein
MDEREQGLAAAAAATALAVALLIAAPAHWSVELALAPLNLEFSATFAGLHIELGF